MVRVPSNRSSSPGFDSRHYQIFWEVIGLERCTLSLVSSIETLLGRKSSGAGLESLEYCRRNQLRWPRDNLCPPKKLTPSSPTSGGRPVGIVRSRTKATKSTVCKKNCHYAYMQGI
jgi:hypothetical protein